MNEDFRASTDAYAGTSGRPGGDIVGDKLFGECIPAAPSPDRIWAKRTALIRDEFDCTSPVTHLADHASDWTEDQKNIPIVAA